MPHSSALSQQICRIGKGGAAALSALLVLLLFGVSLGGCGSAAGAPQPTTAGLAAPAPGPAAAPAPGPAAAPAPASAPAPAPAPATDASAGGSARSMAAASRPGLFVAAPSPTAPPPAPQTSSKATPSAPGTASRSRLPLAGMVIVVDPGHGGSQANGGATGITGLKEKDSNLQLGFALRDALTQAGARVVMTRTTDASPVIPGHPELDQLQARTYIAAHSGANLFISLHANWAPDPTASGLETYYYPGSQAGERLAVDMLRAISQAAQITPRFATSADYAVLHGHPVPAVLLELGYVSNPIDEAHLRSASFRADLVRGIVAGATRFLTGSAG